jgi:hypothetical protein
VDCRPNRFCNYNETVLCRAAQINSAVTKRLFAGELAKEVLQLWYNFSVDR